MTALVAAEPSPAALIVEGQLVKPYLIALAAGLLVGVIYGMLDVRSPAPPVIALVGLLGILLGEQVVPLAKRVLAGHPMTVSAVRDHCGQHVFGRLPGFNRLAGSERTSSHPDGVPRA